MKQLTDAMLNQRLLEINHNLKEPWSIYDNKLHKQFLFKNFISAFSFISCVAMYAEKYNHHPEFYNVYNKVIIKLITHQINAISDKDFELAKAINTIS